MNPEIIGWAASILNAVILAPQAYDSLKTKRCFTHHFSFKFYKQYTMVGLWHFS